MSKFQSPKTTAKTTQQSAAVEVNDVTQQTERFNKAMEYFHARELKKAKDLFEQVIKGPNKGLVFSAQTHLRMCEQRLEKQQVKLETPEDYYNYGIALTNQRRLEDAEKNLRHAIKLQDTDYHHYALAVALALGGKPEEAAEHLTVAIQKDPNNRLAIRNDSDLSEHLSHPAIQAVLSPQNSSE